MRNTGCHRQRSMNFLRLRLTAGNLRQDTSSGQPVRQRLRVDGLITSREPNRGHVDDELAGHRILLRDPIKQGVRSSLCGVQSHDVAISPTRRMSDGEAIAGSVFEDSLSVSKRDPGEGLRTAANRHSLWLREHEMELSGMCLKHRMEPTLVVPGSAEVIVDTIDQVLQGSTTGGLIDHQEEGRTRKGLPDVAA